MDDDVGVATRDHRAGERKTQSSRDLSALWIHVDELDVASWNSRDEPRGKTANCPAADHDDMVARFDARIPHAIDRRLHVGGQHRSGRGNRRRQQINGSGGDDVLRLVRVQDEAPASFELARSPFDLANARVAVFPRRGELARLKRRSHPFELAGWNASLKNKRRGPSADTTVERA